MKISFNPTRALRPLVTALFNLLVAETTASCPTIFPSRFVVVNSILPSKV